MKMKTECNRLKSFLLCGTALLMALALFSFGHASGETAPRKLTLMVYMCGSNLESQYGSAPRTIRRWFGRGWIRKFPCW